MKYDILRIQEASKQRYIDLGIIDLPSRVTGIDEETRGKARNVANYSLGKASRHLCLDCEDTAYDWHHWKSYNKEDWLEVVPLCRSCHRSLHPKLSKGVFYNRSLGMSVRKYLEEDEYMSKELLATIHGVSQESIQHRVQVCNIPNKFMLQAIEGRTHPNKPTKDELTSSYERQGSQFAVSRVYKVHPTTISNWMKSYGIPTNNTR